MSQSPFDLSHLLRPELAQLASYLPEVGAYPVRLDANEAPPLFSAAFYHRMAEEAGTVAWHRYPDATCRALREVLATHSGVVPDQILVGVGSDELICMLLTAFEPGEPSTVRPTMLTLTPTFVMYKMSARARGWQVLEVPLDRNWGLDFRAFTVALSTVKPRLIFLASPNNPTGIRLTMDQVTAIANAAESSIVVLDEAYVDYADDPPTRLAEGLGNVVILRTLSKIGLAALRVGWLVGPSALIRELDKVRQPYNITATSQALAVLAMSELHHEITTTVRAVTRERDRMENALSGLAGLAVTSSEANFLWVRTQGPAEEVFHGLCQRGILVRSFHQRGGRLANQLRITVGTREENQALLAALVEIA